MRYQDLKTFYHGSMDHLPVGTILIPRIDYEVIWGGTDFYYALEEYRPKEMLSHKEAVFMVDNEQDVDLAAGGAEWVFTVKPLGKVEKHDLNWGSEVSMLISDGFDILSDEIQTAALNYWNGIRIPHHSESIWEYLTPSAEILSVEEF